MRKGRIGRTALANFFVAGWLTVFGGAIERAHAQFVNPVPPQQPVFNPSNPYTVPQARPTPVSPGLPGSLPNVAPLPPSYERPASAAARSHRRAAGEDGSYSRHHGRTLTRKSYAPVADYRPPLDDYGPNCHWRQHWDGYWAPDCFW